MVPAQCLQIRGRAATGVRPGRATFAAATSLKHPRIVKHLHHPCPERPVPPPAAPPFRLTLRNQTRYRDDVSGQAREPAYERAARAQVTTGLRRGRKPSRFARDGLSRFPSMVALSALRCAPFSAGVPSGGSRKASAAASESAAGAAAARCEAANRSSSRSRFGWFARAASVRARDTRD